MSVHAMKLLLYTEKNSDICDIKNKTVILKSSSGNDFIDLFRISLSHFTNKFSLRSNLNFLVSVAKMLKSSKLRRL